MAYRLLVNLFSKRADLLKNQKSILRTQWLGISSQSFWKSDRFKKTAIALSVFAVGGGAYGYFTAVPERKTRSVAAESIELKNFYKTAAPDVEPSRQISGPAEDLGLKLLLYQYQTCPFCCKVRVFLDYYGIPYDIVEVNPLKRQQIKFSHYKKVPILIAHDKKTDMKHQLNDSSVIISILATYMLNTSEKLHDILSYYIPVQYVNEEGKKVTEVMNQYFLMFGETAVNERAEEIRNERKWRRWADQEFVHVISPNIYRTVNESLEAFRHYSRVGEWDKHFSNFERWAVIYVGAAAMYIIGKRLKKRHALKDNVRESLYDYSRIWMKNVGKSKFMGGDKPNLADLAVYGILSSIEGCAAFNDLLSNTNIGPWYGNMKEAVDSHYGYELINNRHKARSLG